MSDLSEFFTKLKETYPGAYAVFTLIDNNFNDLCDTQLPKSSLTNEIKEITLHIARDSTGKARLALNKESALFLMAVSESILQLFAKFLTPNDAYRKFESKLKLELEKNPEIIEESTNVCSKCGKVSTSKDVYCSKCGNKLSF